MRPITSFMGLNPSAAKWFISVNDRIVYFEVTACFT
jgi:hypothetical protein